MIIPPNHDFFGMPFFESLDENAYRDVRQHVIEGGAQGHICILNDVLFPRSIESGVYGFPHAGNIGTKSFWRAIAGLSGIGKEDLMFFHRTSGKHDGCKEIHGPFQIHQRSEDPVLFYDGGDSFPVLIDGEVACRARFLYKSPISTYYSIEDNYEFVRRLESKRIWGFRHPSVMNIGAANKTSIVSVTVNQTLELLEMLFSPMHGRIRGSLTKGTLPSTEALNYFEESILRSKESKVFALNDAYLERTIGGYTESVPDEAILYCYFLRAMKKKNSQMGRNLIRDLESVNDGMLEDLGIESVIANAMTEVVISPHLQDTIDVLTCDRNDKEMLIFEMKKGEIEQDAVTQTSRYIDLLKSMFPERRIFANIVGKGKGGDLRIPDRLRNEIRVATYSMEGNLIRLT